jgi:hypothetical protein
LDKNTPVPPPLNLIPIPPSNTANPAWRRSASHKIPINPPSYLPFRGARQTTPSAAAFTVKSTFEEVSYQDSGKTVV